MSQPRPRNILTKCRFEETRLQEADVTRLLKKRWPQQVRCPYCRDDTHVRIRVYTNELIFIDIAALQKKKQTELIQPRPRNILTKCRFQEPRLQEAAVTSLLKKRWPRQVRCPYCRDDTHMRIRVYTNQLMFIETAALQKKKQTEMIQPRPRNLLNK